MLTDQTLPCLTLLVKLGSGVIDQDSHCIQRMPKKIPKLGKVGGAPEAILEFTDIADVPLKGRNDFIKLSDIHQSVLPRETVIVTVEPTRRLGS